MTTAKITMTAELLDIYLNQACKTLHILIANLGKETSEVKPLDNEITPDHLWKLCLIPITIIIEDITETHAITVETDANDLATVVDYLEECADIWLSEKDSEELSTTLIEAVGRAQNFRIAFKQGLTAAAEYIRKTEN